jgi:diguanylate cyclase (GGDEF)-like protein
VNSAGRNGDKIPRCKIICVRVARDAKRIIGYLAFYNPPFAEDFLARHVYLARHLGRQAAGVVESQFDLMTGLYTRDGLLQACAGDAGSSDAAGCVLYIDVDHMQAINEVHGFELGNELIVRVSDLLSRPLLPETALSARLSGDRFAIVIPGLDARSGAAIAEAVRSSAKGLHFGPAEQKADISLSCGVADLVREPDGLDRSITIAEIACKSAKRHGRDRVEVYACDDQSLIQRNDDAAAVGRLRSALQTERVLLRAQRARRLSHPDRSGGYEIELQMREEDGSVVSPAPLLEAAQRYQLMPSIDRWVVKSVLQMLAGYRNLLQGSGVWIAVKLSTQTLGDPAFVEFLEEELKSARLPPKCLILTFGEQAAAARLAQLSIMVRRLRAHGCQFGLEGFGIGTHTLGCIKGLQISRVKICSEFVADVATNPNSKAAVRAIVELAGGLSIETLAEAVEDEAAARLLQELRVDLAQGAVCGAPEPLQDVLRALATEESQRLHRQFLDQ